MSPIAWTKCKYIHISNMKKTRKKLSSVPFAPIRHEPHRAGTPPTTVRGKNLACDMLPEAYGGGKMAKKIPPEAFRGINFTHFLLPEAYGGMNSDKNTLPETFRSKNPARFSIPEAYGGANSFQNDIPKLSPELPSYDPGHDPVMMFYENYSGLKTKIMIQIKSMNLTRLLVASHYEFHRSAEGLMRAAKPSVLHIESLLPEYQEAIDMEFKIINYNQYLTNTELLKELDRNRDRLLSRLFNHIDIAARSPIEEESIAGKALKVIVSPYRGIAHNEYSKETGQIRGLSRDLGTKEAMGHLDTLHIGDLQQKIRRANGDFASAMSERVNTESARTQRTIGIKTTEQQRIVNDLYRQIIRMVNAFAIAEPADEIDAFIELMNAQIDQYKRVIAHQRPGGSGNEKVTPPEDEENI
ncbi:hypothetical protein M2459_001555 [Parabacteroides sp. PF5-5]|nr:hypothetical protein [Parabacteroides sp. PF5-13]MDH6326760.1 hypothetical protein [Parabacteroides sp. PH5-41]MDH6334811.1 hypothetical protein [Parabacteroides sp. PF5-5]MDH6345875.1 hypothetical protein [Parabacteroides sp. PH5-46]MDH6360831.1 hypothetical protein [Parabacteroides sp. PH5-16]MDH6376247.1 hypothetical protein [Parabacteroides sp. PH5-33]